MTNKEFISALSERTELKSTETQHLVEELTRCVADVADEDATLSIYGLGTFEPKKKMERIMVNPTTKQRFLVPPKITLAFKPSSTIKDKLK